MKKTIIAAMLLLPLAACGYDGGGQVHNKGGTLNGEFTKGTVIVDGQTYTCITMKQGIGQNSWGGLWCLPPKK